MAGTKFSDYLGLKHYKKAKKLKHFIHLRLATLDSGINVAPGINVALGTFGKNIKRSS